MLNKIKKRVEKELAAYFKTLDRAYSFDTLSPALFRYMKKFIMRNGKRIRPSFFVVGYLGFTKKAAAGLYTSALSMEFLHNFVLVHDDIIDRSDTRRGAPSAHKMLGQDLAIILGDVIYALGIRAFLTIDEDAERKERALKKLSDAAVYTGAGEFLELLSVTKDIGAITKEDIYRIYDLKTGIYSFATPLAIGAILAGAKDEEAGKLYRCGIYLGRAFQLRDDLADIYCSGHGDLREGKRTILLWYAYNILVRKDKIILDRILSKGRAGDSDISKARKIILGSGSVDCVKKEIAAFAVKAKALNVDSGMRCSYKNIISDYCDGLISHPAR